MLMARRRKKTKARDRPREVAQVALTTQQLMAESQVEISTLMALIGVEQAVDQRKAT
jgi:hypothetical protein